MPSHKDLKTQDQAVGVTQFKSHCLALIDDVARGKRGRVLLMKHNRPVAQVVPVDQTQTQLWGALRGTVKLSPGTDITQPTGETWEAQE